MSERIQAWKRVANTIKFKAYLNTREPEHINQLLSDGELILDHDHDFEFKYSTQQTNPDSRHPKFSNNYDNIYSNNEYLSLSYMNMLLTDKTFIDPRINYFIYRQDIVTAEDFEKYSCFHSIPPEHFDEDDPIYVFLMVTAEVITLQVHLLFKKVLFILYLVFTLLVVHLMRIKVVILQVI